MRYELSRDPGSKNPREGDNCCVMVCGHRKYTLGDEQISNYADMAEHLEFLHRENPPLVLRLYLHDHNGITISTRPFACQRDSDHIGVAYMTHETFEEVFQGDYEKAEKAVESEVETYDSYLKGDVWQYDIFDSEDRKIDSFRGLYGFDNAVEEAKRAMKALEELMRKQGDVDGK